MNNLVRELWVVQMRRICFVGRHFTLKMVQRTPAAGERRNEEMIGGGQGWKGERAEKINNDTSEYKQLLFQRQVSRGEQRAKAELSRYFYQGRR